MLFVEGLKFESEWYNRIIKNSNEKIRLAEYIKKIFVERRVGKLLEVGMGTKPIFSQILAEQVDEYTIIEKEPISPPSNLPTNVNIVNGDFEHKPIVESFDLIVMSHVVYYFSDLESAIRKALGLLKEKGKLLLVVNGVDTDYARTKNAFAKIAGIEFVYTYDRLIEALRGQTYTEHSVETYINYESHEKLYEYLQLFFDLFPAEYLSHKESILKWLRSNIYGGKFYMNQKIIEVTH